MGQVKRREELLQKLTIDLSPIDGGRVTIEPINGDLGMSEFMVA